MHFDAIVLPRNVIFALDFVVLFDAAVKFS